MRIDHRISAVSAAKFFHKSKAAEHLDNEEEVRQPVPHLVKSKKNNSSASSRPLCLEVKPYVQNHDEYHNGHTVTYSSNGEGFPIQVEGSENNHVYNQMFLRDLGTNDVPAIIIQDGTYSSRPRRLSYPPTSDLMEPATAATYRIYAFKPKFFGQKPVKRNSISSSMLYEWAKVEQQSSVLGTTSYAMWTGEPAEKRTGIPTYIAKPYRSPIIMIPLLLLGGGIRYYRPHSMKVLHNHNNNNNNHDNNNNNHEICATIMGKPGSDNWHLELLDDKLDSALFVAFMAIIDEIIVNDYKRRMQICEEY